MPHVACLMLHASVAPHKHIHAQHKQKPSLSCFLFLKTGFRIMEILSFCSRFVLNCKPQGWTVVILSCCRGSRSPLIAIGKTGQRSALQARFNSYESRSQYQTKSPFRETLLRLFGISLKRQLVDKSSIKRHKESLSCEWIIMRGST